MRNLTSLFTKFPIFACVIMLLAASCSKNDDMPPSSAGEKRDRTLILYIASNNNLHDAIWENVQEISEALGNNDDYHVIVYIDTKIDRSDIAEKLTPQILELKGERYLTVEEMSGINTLDSKDMKTVLQKIITKFPADDYGLIFSSHGSGWLPGTKSFGTNDADEGATLEVRDIAANLPIKFKYIIFDACLMADIETVYQMRNCADYLVASVAPVPGHGFDYDEYLHLLLQKEPDLKEFCKSTVNSYTNNLGCTMTVIDCSQLEKLAVANRTVFEKNGIDPTVPSKEATRPQIIYNKMPYVDYMDMVEKLLLTTDGLDELKEQLGSTVTSYYNNGYICGDDVEHSLKAYSGLSHYLFAKDHQYTDKWYPEYQRYDWWKDGGCEFYIPAIKEVYNR